MLEEHWNRKDDVLPALLEIHHLIVGEPLIVVLSSIYQLLCFIVEEELDVVAVIENG